MSLSLYLFSLSRITSQVIRVLEKIYSFKLNKRGKSIVNGNFVSLIYIFLLSESFTVKKMKKSEIFMIHKNLIFPFFTFSHDTAIIGDRRMNMRQIIDNFRNFEATNRIHNKYSCVHYIHR